jgi:FMN phosphatase YigB (HAD superfamily)
LIIFDLDDTLIDTSGCITPIQLEKALKEMDREGLQIPEGLEALDLLTRLDAVAESAREAISEFVEIIGADKRFYEIGCRAVYHEISNDFTVFALENAYEILNLLKQNHQLALVSVGVEHQQLLKMKKAGIDSTLFSKIIISRERDKKPHYSAIMEELGFQASDVLVCGDRVEIDLAPAKELGIKTVHMQWGRGANPFLTYSKDKVDFEITELTQIREIIAAL